MLFEQNTFGDLGIVGGNNIKIDHKLMCWVGVEWLAMADNRRKWWAFVDTVMKFRVGGGGFQ
jgi:hypothetical protein